MEKRFLLAIAISFVILFVYQYYIEKQQREWKQRHPHQDAPTQVSEGERAPQNMSAPTGEAESPSGVTKALPPPEMRSDTAPSASLPCDEVVVESPLYKAVLCSHTGQLMSWKLTRYKVGEKCACRVPGLGFIFGGSNGTGEQAADEPIERIHIRNPMDQPLGLEIIGEGYRRPVQASYTPDRSGLDLTDETSPKRISFVGQSSLGTTIRKTYTFSPDSYLVHLLVEIEDIRSEFQDLSVGLILTEKMSSTTDRYAFSGFMGFVDGSLVKEEPKKISKEEPRYHAGNVEWAGFSDKYFLTGVLPINNPVTSIKIEKAREELLTSSFIYHIRPHLDGSKAVFEYNFYIGPKDLDVLKKTGFSLEKSMDLGWFGPIAKPLLITLKFFNRFTHNYGIAIIILTVIIKILFHPLTRKQYQSMKEMQKLAPKMQAIREKFKNDRDKMNKEIMDLYRTHKINPLGGCWPMLLQIPVFIALYKALLNSIELRQAPFFLWIKDLSDKDPCYITPIVMGLSMFFQQKMSPQVGDPTQQKMMMFMPIIFTVMFFNFPSGLVVYWLVNNVISIGQQYFSQKEGR